MKLIQVYAPTSNRPDEEVEQLYEEVQCQLTTDCHYHIVMGDFNAKIGIKSDEQERTTGKFGSRERNERGDLLIEWATANNLKIMNTIYKKKISRRWTWQSPDGCTRNEIDYIMTNRPNIFTDVKVLNRLDAGSDHRAVMGVIRINVRKDRQKCLSNPSKRPSIEQLVIKKDEFQILLTNRFSALELEGEDGVDEMNDRITTTIPECASEVPPASKMKDSKLSTEMRILMKKRWMMKKMEVNNNRDIRNNIGYAELDKTIKKKAREDIRKQNMKKIAETIKNGKSMKRAKISFQLGQDRMLTLLDKDENELTTQDQILERVEEFYGELYDSNKGIEISTKACNLPDITAWEVESAVQKMKNGKAAGN
ncbi:craniofacial development protein 2-like [Lingula anatina]|uniref:Craniofacial development protein 2-like n=1 Tax=Lingula anatina TaxID=7574 RepID=A0A1S3HDJ9_LINAN|nr:craniofacial development protein 2-like [Lingula anatina]|eukprot:XP_013384095.1 craniofacial development protein 2-like [Lingula anatina]